MARGDRPVPAGLLIDAVPNSSSAFPAPVMGGGRLLLLMLSVALWACGGEEPAADAGSQAPSEAADSRPSGSIAPEQDHAEPDAGVEDDLDDPDIPPPPVVVPNEPPEFERPEHIRGLYVNAWTAGSTDRVGRLLAIAARTEVNAFVVDIKDASGFVSHSTAVPLAREVGATGEIRIPNLLALLWRLREAGVYPIARIVIVKDPVLVAGRPDLAVQDTAGGVWVDGSGIRWLNPYDREVWDYHVDLAREVARMGFPEIQWDYARFPDAPRSDLERTVYPGSEGESKPAAIRRFLEYSREALADEGVEVTVDVFGVTTTARDVGIGQVWDQFIDVIDVALPMVYPSHYHEGSYGIEDPNGNPYSIVRKALEDAVSQSAGIAGAGKTRPWLQAFSLGQPPYEAPEVRAQIQGTYDAGIEEWILWNPGSRYIEGALEPVGGFPSDPLIRLGEEIVPASERFEVLEGARVADSIAAAAAAAARDTTGVVR